jgi:hypothetical protein
MILETMFNSSKRGFFNKLTGIQIHILTIQLKQLEHFMPKFWFHKTDSGDMSEQYITCDL